MMLTVIGRKVLYKRKVCDRGGNETQWKVFCGGVYYDILDKMVNERLINVVCASKLIFFPGKVYFLVNSCSVVKDFSTSYSEN